MLNRCRQALESEKPLRELEFKPEEMKMLTGFMFLTRKPMLYVLNLGDEEAADIDRVIEKHHLEKLATQAADGGGAILRKNRSGAGRTGRRRSRGDDESVRSGGIRARPADSGQLPAARVDFISHLRRTGSAARGRSSAA